MLVRDAAAQLNVTFVPWTAMSSSGVADVVRVLRSPALGVVDELVVGPLEPGRELGEAGEPVCLCASPVRSDWPGDELVFVRMYATVCLNACLC